MSKAKYQRKLQTNLVENGLLLMQSKLDTGVTIKVTRPFLGKFIEPAADRKGVGHDFTPIIKDAVLGKVGMKVVQAKTGHKEVTVEVTGL